MRTPPPIKSLFANDIHRGIEEVIEVDQTDEAIIAEAALDGVREECLCLIGAGKKVIVP
jgi:hypothetical protein